MWVLEKFSFDKIKCEFYHFHKLKLENNGKSNFGFVVFM